MKILIINCHTDNRGDEAAIHALIDELNILYKDLNITLALRGAGTPYPNMPQNVKMIHQFMPISKKSKLAHKMAKITKGRFILSSNEKNLIEEIRTANFILHAPGGPSIGDTYYEDEPTYLEIYDLIRIMNKPYMFYAPSMGPFNRTDRNKWRRVVISNAEAVVLRDPISAEYVRNLLPKKKIYQTLDSAFQHDIDVEENGKKLEEYIELYEFLKNHKKCVGVTITDLLWHPIHSKDKKVIQNIHDSFTALLDKLVCDGYGIIFIPQLYGKGNDYDLMKKYALDEKNYFVILDNNDKYDTYFQQYVIGQLYAVIGMRYHSNIFSAKMGTPFISISYEQKMQGFMEKMDLCQYCLQFSDLSADNLKEKFKLLCDSHQEYKSYLEQKHDEMKADVYKTTEILKTVLEKLEIS